VCSYEIVRCELCFDVRLGDDAADAHIHSLEDLRNVEVDIHHRHIEAVVVVVFKELIAEETARNHETVIESINARNAKAPIDVIGLEFVRYALEVENELVLLKTVRTQVVNERKVRVRSARCVGRSAKVP